MGNGFFAELKRRNVPRAAVFYAASAWLLVQVATQVFPFFQIDASVVRWIVIAAVAGFPLAMLFAWVYEWAPNRLRREGDLQPQESITRDAGRKLDFWIIGILGVSVVLLLVSGFAQRDNANAVIDKSIAVLPLANDSGDNNEQYFSDGLSEDLITALSQFNGLKVISRNSSFQFRDSKDDSKAIGHKLGAAHLLEGSVRRDGNQVRVIVNLINAADGSTLWSQRYDRPYRDLFALQDDITSAIATALEARLLPNAGGVHRGRPPSGNLAAYNAYLQGTFYEARNTEADFRKARGYYQQAIDLDPRYALGHAALSLLSTRMAGRFLEGDAMRAMYAQARKSADTALALSPNLAVAHLARGRLLVWADFDWAGGQSEYRRALQLAPNNVSAKTSFGEMLATLGHPDQAVTLTRQVLATDALDAHTWHLLATYLMALGRLDEAARALREAIELQPAMLGNHEQLTIIEILRGNAADALRAARLEQPGDWQDAARTRALQIGADRVAADAALKTLIDRQADKAAYQIAQVQALRKAPDQVFAWLDRAWASHDPGIGLLLYDPLLLPYQHDPRFAAFCRKVRLPVLEQSVPGEVAPATAVVNVSAPSGKPAATVTSDPPTRLK